MMQFEFNLTQFRQANDLTLRACPYIDPVNGLFAQCLQTYASPVKVFSNQIWEQIESVREHMNPEIYTDIIMRRFPAFRNLVIVMESYINDLLNRFRHLGVAESACHEELSITMNSCVAAHWAAQDLSSRVHMINKPVTNNNGQTPQASGSNLNPLAVAFNPKPGPGLSESDSDFHIDGTSQEDEEDDMLGWGDNDHVIPTQKKLKRHGKKRGGKR